MKKKVRKKKGQVHDEFITVPYLISSVFILAESVEHAQGMIDEGWYGLAERGFVVSGRFQLIPLGMETVKLPKTGCYETCIDVYRKSEYGPE